MKIPNQWGLLGVGVGLTLLASSLYSLLNDLPPEVRRPTTLVLGLSGGLLALLFFLLPQIGVGVRQAIRGLRSSTRRLFWPFRRLAMHSLALSMFFFVFPDMPLPPPPDLWVLSSKTLAVVLQAIGTYLFYLDSQDWRALMSALRAAADEFEEHRVVIAWYQAREADPPGGSRTWDVVVGTLLAVAGLAVVWQLLLIAG